MGLYWSFLQVLDHHVGNSGQVTHVASPGAAVGPEVERGEEKKEEAKEIKNRT